MNNAIFIEFGLMAAKFEHEKQRGGSLYLELVAIERNDADINEQLKNAFISKQDVAPVLAELKDNFLQRAQATKTFGQHVQQMEALCLQSAELIQRFIDVSK